MKDRDEFPMILVGNKADLELQRQVSATDCRDLSPLTDKHIPCLIISNRRDNITQSGGVTFAYLKVEASVAAAASC